MILYFTFCISTLQYAMFYKVYIVLLNAVRLIFIFYIYKKKCIKISYYYTKYVSNMQIPEYVGSRSILNFYFGLCLGLKFLVCADLKPSKDILCFYSQKILYMTDTIILCMKENNTIKVLFSVKYNIMRDYYKN